MRRLGYKMFWGLVSVCYFLILNVYLRHYLGVRRYGDYAVKAFASIDTQNRGFKKFCTVSFWTIAILVPVVNEVLNYSSTNFAYDPLTALSF